MYFYIGDESVPCCYLVVIHDPDAKVSINLIRWLLQGDLNWTPGSAAGRGHTIYHRREGQRPAGGIQLTSGRGSVRPSGRGDDGSALLI